MAQKSVARKQHEQDMETLARELLAAAEEHELCEEFYAVIEKINKELNLPLNVKRTKSYEFSLNVNFNINDVEVELDRFGGIEPTEEIIDRIEQSISNALAELGAYGFSVDTIDWNERR